MTIDEAIKHCEEVANLKPYINEYGQEVTPCGQTVTLEKFRQLAEWLRELQVHREINDVLLQLLVDFDLDICCDDLMDDEKETLICEESCNNKSKGCWVRWAKLKAREVKADDE